MVRAKQTAQKSTSARPFLLKSSAQAEAATGETRPPGIKTDLETLILNGFAFDGNVAFSKKYPMGDAPNPYLAVDGLGSLGIPLGQRDAQAFSFSDKHICEVTSDKISFDNPQWNSWAQDTIAQVVAEKLALPGPCSLAFRKLVIGRSGCEEPIVAKEFVSHSSMTWKLIKGISSSSAVGHVIVFLSSNFDGGPLNVKYGGRQNIFNVATDSGAATTIVAWYAKCQLDFGSVKDGYRLALVYDIEMVPPLDLSYSGPPDMSELTQKLRQILQTWKESDSVDPPTHLACVLRRTYKRSTSFSSMSLKGADKLLLKKLGPLARELGFKLHLAHAEGQIRLRCYIRGYDPLGYEDYGDDEYDESEFEDEGSDDDGEHILEVKQVVDMGGMPVDVDELRMVMYDEDDPGHAAFICGPVIDRSRAPDKTEFERDEIFSANRIKTWNRTVLLIWLDDSEIGQSVVPGNMHAYAAHFLSKSTTTNPTRREKTVAEALVSRIKAFKYPVEKKHANDDDWFFSTEEQQAKAKKKEASRIPAAVTLLRQCAERWKDLELLLRVLAISEAEQNISIVGVDGLASACGTFGWDVLKDFCAKAIQTDPSITRKHGLVDRFIVLAAEHNMLDLARWCTEQKAILPAVAEEAVTGGKRPSTENDKTIPAKKRKA
ncbi:hypothetical protein MIND_01321600 [Mycena indigotica]|uniref:Uncharacterized protein n=1 Tax=Mycena indigotica TaxID=2126181 RepID=A0A8H6VSY2_9AGAR|nr:uncharacterized protein MIND_01321600 [Mycena indigotica]KAF7290806.1 hypothetical protein MIND_01321600 [Mycena indigotica]